MKKHTIVIIISILILSLIVFAETAIILWMAHPKKKISSMPPPSLKGSIAIVLDDWGYNQNNLDLLKQIHYPLTLSILPNLGYSNKISREAHSSGFEVILHLPMEPQENLKLERNTILTSMNEKEIRAIVSQDLKSIAYAKGVSNHMGSKATKDTRIMAIVFSELQKNGLYFLDSYVSSGSVCFDLAHKMHLNFVRRDVFLDNNEDSGYIKGQMNKLKMKAKLYGRAVGIGHDRHITLQVLKEVLPVLEKEGYRIVRLSELTDN